jgi:hypothetical protein
MNGKLTNTSDSVHHKRRSRKLKFVVSVAEGQMSRNKKRSHPLPAIAFVYLALVGGLLLLSASRVLAL